VPTSAPTATLTPTHTPTKTPTPLPPTSTPTPFPPFRDDFNQLLEEGWTWVKESRFGWGLHEKPGFLRIEVELDTNQVLLRHAPEGDFEISTRVLFTPFSNFQSAGLIIFQDDRHWLSFHRGMCDFITQIPEACQGNAIYFNHIDYDLGVPGEGYSIGPQFPTRTVEMSEAYLRLTRKGRTYTAYYSDDGETWETIGRHESDIFPFYVGLHTFGAQKYLADADFDFFTLEILP
jgi:beta-xylosidase